MDAPRSDGVLTRRLRRIGAALVEALQLRYELASVEMREERGRLVGLLFQAVSTALLFCMAFLFLNLVLLLTWWEYRVAIALALGGLYLVGAIVLAFVLRYRLRHQSPPFAGTVEELRKDVAALSSTKG